MNWDGIYWPSLEKVLGVLNNLPGCLNFSFFACCHRKGVFLTVINVARMHFPDFDSMRHDSVGFWETSEISTHFFIFSPLRFSKR